MKIIPAVLAERKDDFLSFMKQAEQFADYVQIDLMDGIFVPSRSVPASIINDLATSVDFELHLMVKHPSSYMSAVKHPRMKRVIYHVESEVKHDSFVRQLTEQGIVPGIAIKPETPLTHFQNLVDGVGTLMFMTVDPGFYGSPFKASVIEKIGETRARFPDVLIGVDGGVSLDNLHLFLDAGVDYVCVGSRIFRGDDPGENYRSFVKRVEDLKESRRSSG